MTLKHIPQANGHQACWHAVTLPNMPRNPPTSWPLLIERVRPLVVLAPVNAIPGPEGGLRGSHTQGILHTCLTLLGARHPLGRVVAAWWGGKEGGTRVQVAPGFKPYALRSSHVTLPHAQRPTP